MKVVHISTYTFGGAGIAMYRLHESLVQNSSSVDSHIVQSQPIQGDSQDNIHQCTHLHPLSYRIKKRLGLLPYFSDLERYQKIICSQPVNYDIVSLPFSYYPIHLHPAVLDADIIHLHWTCDFLDYKSFFQNIKQPIVWTLHDIYPFMGIYHFRGDKEKNKFSPINRIDEEIRKYKQEAVNIKQNIHIVCPSKWMLDQSVGSKIFQKYDHSVIPNGFDVRSFRQIDKPMAKQVLGLNNNKRTIFFGADHLNMHGKGMDILMEALKNIPKDSYNLLTVGNGAIAELLSLTSTHKHFGFLNSLDLLNLIYSVADITIIPSREDNLPSMMIESMLNSTPVLSFANGGMAEHIKTGENGILVPEMTVECLASNIKDFLNDKYTFDSKKIREYAVETFNYEKLAHSYTELYRSLLNK